MPRNMHTKARQDSMLFLDTLPTPRDLQLRNFPSQTHLPDTREAKVDVSPEQALGLAQAVAPVGKHSRV